MLKIVDLEYNADAKTLASRIRDALDERKIVRVPKFSRNQNDMTALAAQFGTEQTVPGSTVPGPLHVANQSDFTTAPWHRSTLPIHQRIHSHTPAIVLEYCVTPTSFIRWFTDQCDLFEHYAWSTRQALSESIGVYGSEEAPILRIESVSSRPYLAITDDLRAIKGADEKIVLDLISHAKNIHGFGLSDLYLDCAEDLLVYSTDGCAVGRLPGPKPRQGLWMHMVVKPQA